VSYLPAPYESAQQDDLAAALAAGLTATLAGITSWVLGRWAYHGIRSLIDDGKANQQLPSSVLVPTVGWSIAVVLLVVGALLLLFRRGRGWVILGALVSIATTAVAQYELHLGPAAQSQWWLYWGGIGVLVVAALPATGRWVAEPAAAAAGFPTTAVYRPH
jgi:F0F1-type ATP synthase membrane subunit c/vacuolar-type H+-ATPase subunit K